MDVFNINDGTICAVSTPAGVGGIAVIRVSGEDAISIVDRVFKPFRGSRLSEREAYTATFGQIFKGENLLDEVVAVLFRAPHSFTGEDVVELSCHGSLFIQQELMGLLVEQGCRVAGPGEFTQRAFLNGKMDLSQAEAVADLIASSSAGAHRLAMNQMKGGFSNELEALRSRLIDFISLIELELDFSEEDVEFADRTELLKLAKEIDGVIDRLASSFKTGNAIKQGIPVAIVGETNSGKSTLLNLLLGEERAIVSDVHGTTRDVIEDVMGLDGITFRFIDTAGIRETQDQIESLGIERTFDKLRQASIICWVIDLKASVKESLELGTRLIPLCEGKDLIVLLNKCDALDETTLKERVEEYQSLPGKKVVFSAKKKLNVESLQQELIAAAHLPQLSNSDVIVSNARHYEALIRAGAAVRRVLEGLESGISGDFLSQDIRECMHYLGEITGVISSDTVLHNIFSKFCIGK